MPDAELIALVQPGEQALALGLRLIGLIVLGFFLLEILYLVGCALFLARGRDAHRRNGAALLLTLVALLPVLPGCGTSRMVDAARRPVRYSAAGIVGRAAPAGQSPSPYRPPTPAGLDEFFFLPEENPLTPAKIALGRRLFFDPVLSRDSTMACSSCHRPERGFSDTLPTSIGIAGQPTARNAPTLLNRAYGVTLFWDGRAATLEEAVLQPVRNPREMDHDPARAAERLARDRSYAGEFARAFEDGASTRNLARALASFVRSLRSGNAAVDRYLAGEAGALSPEARAGLRIFAGRGNCVMCHSGANFTDERFHNTGVSWGFDPGRFGATGVSADRGAFKTPTLRNVARTGPYMHDGSLATLEDVIAFYDRGGNPNPNLDPEIRPLRLTAEERRALRAFLQALTGQ